MSNLTDVPLIRCVVLGDSDRLEVLRRYAELSGLPFDDEVCEVITAFNGQKCQFLDATSFGEKGLFHGEIHAILMCVSVAREATVEETVRMVMETIMAIGSIPFVLVGTQIDKRTKLLQEGATADRSVLPMSLSQAETFAKRIGASKYLECSASTGEGVDEVFEDAFEVGRKFAVEQLRIVQRKKSGVYEENGRKQSCIQQ